MSFNDTMIHGIFEFTTTFMCSLDGALDAFLDMTRTYVRGWFSANNEKEF
jgi:hypothetical protein